MGFTDFSSESGLTIANTFFRTRSYVEGYTPTQADVITFKAFKNAPDATKYPHAARWYKHIASYESEYATLKGDPSQPFTIFGPKSIDLPVSDKKAPEDDDEDLDLFGSDDDEEEDAALIAEREKNLAAYRSKPSKKPPAKSFVTLDIKPMSSRTPLPALRDAIKKFLLEGPISLPHKEPLQEKIPEKREGLIYSSDSFLPVGFGIKKLRVSFSVEDEKISISDLQDDIEKYFGDEETGLFKEKEIVDSEGEVIEDEEGWVQSTDLVSIFSFFVQKSPNPTI
ncbi:elongation factor 1-beta [[Emmonsia] crescens]|uniref:Elongation factor 1-beta n=1 Tax=[Emmonsia] crescens TaxID=73230 RepID=A0A2B7ZNI0_9EURO|nr:elongation factor 1-beta [Emmonsia crescens]